MSSKALDPLALPLDGTQIIEASAGTGKTYTITTIVLRLLLETELTVDQIVVVTFTRAATSELRDRIRQRIKAAASVFEKRLKDGEQHQVGDPVLELLLETQPADSALRRLRRALQDLDRAAIFTIHGFAQRMLQEHAFESGARFDLELVGDQRSLITEVAHDYWAREIATLSEETWRAVEVCKVTIDSFIALGHVAVAGPDLPLNVEVAPVSSNDIERHLTALSEAWADAAEEYRRGASQAFELLSDSALHQSYYGPSKLAEYRRQLDDCLFSKAELFGKTPAAIRCLATGNIKTKKNHQAPSHPLFDAMARLERALEDSRSATARFVDALRCQFVHFARQQVVVEHDRLGTQSFDDLLHSMRRALADRVRGQLLARQVRQRFPVALIDEFQDTDPVQYEIFNKIYAPARQNDTARQKGAARPKDTAQKLKRCGLFLIGDPKQAIYAFRGADIHAYLEAVRDAASGQWTLTTNYRSDPGFVAALNHLFSRLQEPFLHPQIRYTNVSPAPDRRNGLLQNGAPVTPLEVVYLDRDMAGRSGTTRWEGLEEWQLLAAQEVARLLNGRFTLSSAEGMKPLEPRHIAILTRTNRQAQVIQEHLRLLGVPSVLHGDRTVFEAPEATELAFILRALAEPSSGTAVRTALGTRFLGLDAQELAALADDEFAWEQWSLRFREWNGVWAERGVMQCLQRLLRDQHMVPRTLREMDGERRLTNLRHLAELLHQAECEGHLGIPGLLQWFDEVRLDPTRQGMAPDAQQLRLESDADAVVLTTMHRSKGLEFPVVILPFLGAKSEPFGAELENLKFHNPQRGNRLELDVRSRPDKTAEIELATEEHQAEAMRLAYVALTRARHHCLVLWGGVSGAFSSLGYLLHQPAVELGGLSVDVAARLKDLNDGARWAELETLAKGSGNTIGVRRGLLEGAPVYVRPDLAESLQLQARRFEGRVPSGLRTSSFSAMTRGQDPASLNEREGRDLDEATPSESLSDREVEHSQGMDAAATQRDVTLAQFPKGAKPGELLHSILERIPFGCGEQAERRQVVDAELSRHGFAAEHAPVVQQAIEEVLATPLTGASAFTLADLAPTQRMSEMEFTLPVGLSEQLSIRTFVDALVHETQAPWPSDYLRRLARLEAGAWSGFLRGYIDLIFEREGKFYVADYKSNHLGPSPQHYRLEHIVPIMAEHHYYLQYLLYSVALHRYLGQRVSDYSVESHFGGVYYLFLRGMHPETGPEHGVFFHRPSSELIERLSLALEGVERRKAG